MRILDRPISKNELIKSSTNFIDDNTIKAVIRPAQGNRTRNVENADTRAKIKNVVKDWIL